jgi:monofunctional glycosyltransferase
MAKLRTPWRMKRLLSRAALAVLLGPLLLILLFRFLPVPLTPLMMVRLAQGYELHHDWVAYDSIAPELAHAVVASEDNLFCREPFGFDDDALLDQIDLWRRTSGHAVPARSPCRPPGICCFGRDAYRA